MPSKVVEVIISAKQVMFLTLLVDFSVGRITEEGQIIEELFGRGGTETTKTTRFYGQWDLYPDQNPNPTIFSLI